MSREALEPNVEKAIAEALHAPLASLNACRHGWMQEDLPLEPLCVSLADVVATALRSDRPALEAKVADAIEQDYRKHQQFTYANVARIALDAIFR